MQNSKPRGPSPIHEILRSVLRENGLGARARGSAVFESWTQCLGTEVAPHAVPVRFQKGRLTVEVDSPTRLHELRTFTGELYRKKTNDALGSQRVKQVVYKLRG